MSPSTSIRTSMSRSDSSRMTRRAKSSGHRIELRDDSGSSSDDDVDDHDPNDSSRGRTRSKNRNPGNYGPTSSPSNSNTGQNRFTFNTPAINIPSPTVRFGGSNQVAGSVSIITFTTVSVPPPSSVVTTVTQTTIADTSSDTASPTVSSSGSSSSTSLDTSSSPPPRANSSSSPSPFPLPPPDGRGTLKTAEIFAIVLGLSTLLSIIICCILYRSKVRRIRGEKLQSTSHRGRTISSFEPAEYTGNSLFRFPSTMHRSLKSCVTLPSFYIFGSPPQQNADLEGQCHDSPTRPSAALLPYRSSNRWTRSTYDGTLSSLNFMEKEDSFDSYYDHDFDDIPEMEFIGSTMTHSVEHAKRSSFGTNSLYHAHTKSILKFGGLDAPLPPLPSSKSIKWEKNPFLTSDS